MAEKYNYRITADYYADTEYRHFDTEITATDNIEAMEIIIGRLAWKVSNEGKTFKLDFIHYDVM